MSPIAGILLGVAIVAMIGLVVFLARLNARNIARDRMMQTSSIGLVPRGDAERLASLDFLWNKAAIGRSARELHEGRYGGWTVRTFLFAPKADLVSHGIKAGARVFAHGWLPVAGFALDHRTATQRGVLVAVDHRGDAASFKISIRGRLLARNDAGRELLGGSSVPLRGRVPPARCRVEDGWFHLASFYVVPKWIVPYVQASTEICRMLADRGDIKPREAAELPAALF